MKMNEHEHALIMISNEIRRLIRACERKDTDKDVREMVQLAKQNVTRASKNGVYQSEDTPTKASSSSADHTRSTGLSLDRSAAISALSQARTD